MSAQAQKFKIYEKKALSGCSQSMEEGTNGRSRELGQGQYAHTTNTNRNKSWK